MKANALKVKEETYFYNHVDNILRLFDGSASFPFTTSETKHDF